MLSGYNNFPCERNYWSTSEDLGCKLVVHTMSRGRFLELKRFLHLADNQNLSSSKVAKVEPLYKMLNRNLVQFGICDSKLSIDESMVPYYGHHSAKMFIRGKPIRFGYKIWMLCSSDGQPYQASIYCGRSDRPKEVGLGEQVVLSFMHHLKNKNSHHVFFDNFFTSHHLLLKLRELGVKATGTMREGRHGDAPLSAKNNFSKNNRGKFEFTGDGSVVVVRCSDNNVVTCASNYDSVEPIKKVQRHVKGSREKATVSQPLMIANYTGGMGGVDMLDRLLSAYRPRIKGKKWWWNLFLNAVNIAVVASWRMHCKLCAAGDSLPHLQFLREVVYGLLRGVQRQRLGGHTAPVPGSVRFDGSSHYLETVKQGRCNYCKSNTTKQCGKCNKRLHERCFVAYHQN